MRVKEKGEYWRRVAVWSFDLLMADEKKHLLERLAFASTEIFSVSMSGGGTVTANRRNAAKYWTCITADQRQPENRFPGDVFPHLVNFLMIPINAITPGCLREL